MKRILKYLLTKKYFARNERANWWENGASSRELTLSFIHELKKQRFDHQQMHAILNSFALGLTQEQVRIVADSRFSYYQMSIVAYGLNQGVTLRAMKFIVNEILGRYRLTNPTNLMNMASNRTSYSLLKQEAAKQDKVYKQNNLPWNLYFK